MQSETVILGGLRCRVVEAESSEAPAELIVVLCHGFGAPGTDLVPLGAELFHLHPGLAGRVRFIFPEAPLSLESFGMPGGRAWWPLNVEKLMMSIETGDFRDLRRETPPGLAEARAMLTQLVQKVQDDSGLPTSRIVLGGFSQGSMLATDVSLHLPDSPAALCVFSGTLLCEEEWRELASRRGPLPVLQSHGTNDPILPFQGAEWLRELFENAGFEVDFVPFRGIHTIPFEALHRFASLLGRLLGENRS